MEACAPAEVFSTKTTTTEAVSTPAAVSCPARMSEGDRGDAN
jgi:hypothetical protein